MPSASARMVCSIFIASSTTSACPASTTSPTATATCVTVPGTGVDGPAPPPSCPDAAPQRPTTANVVEPPVGVDRHRLAAVVDGVPDEDRRDARRRRSSRCVDEPVLAPSRPRRSTPRRPRRAVEPLVEPAIACGRMADRRRRRARARDPGAAAVARPRCAPQHRDRRRRSAVAVRDAQPSRRRRARCGSRPAAPSSEQRRGARGACRRTTSAGATGPAPRGARRGRRWWCRRRGRRRLRGSRRASRRLVVTPDDGHAAQVRRASAAAAAGAVGAVRDHLRQHRVVVRRDDDARARPRCRRAATVVRPARSQAVSVPVLGRKSCAGSSAYRRTSMAWPERSISSCAQRAAARPAPRRAATPRGRGR